MDYDKKLAFKCRKLKAASLIRSTFARDVVIHIMKSDCGKSEKFTRTSKLAESFLGIGFHSEE